MTACTRKEAGLDFLRFLGFKKGENISPGSRGANKKEDILCGCGCDRLS
jgi:hypothetical protein